MKIKAEHQKNEIADPVDALVAVTRPIFAAVLAGVSAETLAIWGKDRIDVPLAGLANIRTSSDGETGVAFEYAVHSAILDRNPIVLDRVTSALKKCNISSSDPSSILFAVEKQRQAQLIATNHNLITSESSVLSGKAGRPVKLKAQLSRIESAFRRKGVKTGLPQSISGLWKADLFIGDSSPDKWVGTTVKTNPRHLEGFPGLRVAIIPAMHDRSDSIYKDESKNLIVCPMPYDQSFMQIFYEGRRVVQALLDSDFKEPKQGVLTSNVEREVARMWIARKSLTVNEALEAMSTFEQKGLLERVDNSASTEVVKTSSPVEESSTTTLVAPFARLK